MDAKIIEQRVVYDRWSTITEALVRLPNGAIEKRLIEDHGGAAAVLLYDPERRVALLLRQPRAPLIASGEAPLLEVVAGRLDGKTGEETARAEAYEEAGVRVGQLEPVASLWMMPACSTERLELYLAAYSSADRLGPGGGAADENECIVIEEVGLCEMRRMAQTGGLSDAKTFLLFQALMMRQPELFA